METHYRLRVGNLKLGIGNNPITENNPSGSFAMAGSSFKNECPQEDNRSGSFVLAESSSKLENPLEKMPAEENNPDTLPVIMVNAAARSDILDIEEKRNSSEKTREKAWNFLAKPIVVLDPWNMSPYNTAAMARTDFPGMVIRKNPMERYKHRKCLDAGKLRKDNPNLIPVTLEKDTRSDIPDIGPKKFQVHGGRTLGEFVDFIRLWIRLSRKKPIYVFFKNTSPTPGALMSAIDEENKDEDGFLHMTYSGEEKNVNENSRSESFALAESSFKLENPLVRTQAEENNPDPMPMIVENTSHIPDIEEQKNSSEKKRKLVWPITFLDPWNTRGWNMGEALEKNLRDDPGMDKQKRKLLKKLLKGFKPRTIPEAGQLRQERPNHIPVSVEKDARSDIPDIGMKKFQVHGNMPLGQFVDFIAGRIEPSIRKPIFVFFKNTEPPSDALMSAVDEKNKDEDGFLHITYSGEEKRVCESNEEQQECFAGNSES